VVLTQDCGKALRKEHGEEAAAAAASARRRMATPLVLDLVKAYPAACERHVMQGVRYEEGHLPLELALTRHWGADVCGAILKAYPAAEKVVESAKQFKKPKHAKKEEAKKSGGEKPPATLRLKRWMRKAAEQADADDDVLVLLSKPKVADGKIVWTDGATIAKDQAEKLRKKLAKEEKRKVKAAARREKLAKKKAKADAKAAKAAEADAATAKAEAEAKAAFDASPEGIAAKTEAEKAKVAALLAEAEV